MTKIRVRLLCASIAGTIFLCGCTPYKELKEESIVEGMGIDTGSKGGYNLTLQIFKPQKSSDASKSSFRNTITESSGQSLFDGVRNATLKQGRKLYFSNNRAYILGENVCKKGISKTTDFMQRNHEIKPEENIYMSRGNAGSILSAKKNGEIIPAADMQFMSNEYAQTSKTANIQLDDLFNVMATGITDPVIPVLKLEKDKSGNSTVVMDGIGIFHKEKLVGYLNPNETRGLLWVNGKVDSGDIVVHLKDGGTATMEIHGEKTKVTATTTHGKPYIIVDVNFKSNITEIESNCSNKVSKSNVEQYIKLQSSEVKSEITSAIKKSLNGYGADIFGFGMKIYENEPEVFRAMQKNYQKNIKNLDVEVNVDSQITENGIITQ